MAMILFSLTLYSVSLIFCVHTAASFFSVFIPSCLPCSGSLPTFFFVIWNIVLYRIIFHSLLLTFIPRYIQFFYYSAFCGAPPLSLAPFTWLCYILHSTLNNIKQPLSYMNEYGTMKSWKKQKKVYVEIWQWKVSFCRFFTLQGEVKNPRNLSCEKLFLHLAILCLLP